MATGQVTSAGPIHLNFQSVQQVVVHPEDENRFMMTAKEAARACELAQNAKELRDQFTQFILYLHVSGVKATRRRCNTPTFTPATVS